MRIVILFRPPCQSEPATEDRMERSGLAEIPCPLFSPYMEAYVPRKRLDAKPVARFRGRLDHRESGALDLSLHLSPGEQVIEALQLLSFGSPSHVSVPGPEPKAGLPAVPDSNECF